MLRRELAYFFGALRFFTRLPVPAWVGHSSEALDRTTRYFPAVGLLVGAIAALVFVLTSFFLPMTLAVLAAMASSLYLTGRVSRRRLERHGRRFRRRLGEGTDPDDHEGLANRQLRRDRAGHAAARPLLRADRVRVAEVPLALLAGHTLSRFAATTLLRGLDYVRDEGKAKPLATRIGWGELGFAGLTALLPLLLLPPLEASARRDICRPGDAMAGAPVPAADRWLYRRLPRRHPAMLGTCFLLRAAVQLFLIRHPPPRLAAGVCYGQLDVEAEDPQPIAERLRALLPATTPVIASPLRRARCLAEALHPQPVFDERLLEIELWRMGGRRLGADRSPAARCLGCRCAALRHAGRRIGGDAASACA
jgi:adenosylcobinamide-GDP ribazoletransferase